MTLKQSETTIAELKELLTEDNEFLQPLIAEVVQRVLEGETDAAYLFDALTFTSFRGNNLAPTHY